MKRDLIAGRSYRLLERIGAGELGEVWKALHEGNGRHCAIKFLRPAWKLEPAAVQAFVRDAKASGALRQPALVELLDQGVFEGVPYVVMPLLRGEKLERIIQKHGALPLEATLRLCEAIAQGLVAAHEERVFHRRIEAANVFVQLDDKGRIIPRLMDFGIARLGRGPTQLISPHAYLAPEQLAGDTEDGRADVWALATLIAHCVLGTIPHTPSMDEPLDEQLDAALVELRAKDAQLAALIATGWAIDRVKRPTMAIFARKLRELTNRRGGTADALVPFLSIPESIAPSVLESEPPPAPPAIPKLPPLPTAVAPVVVGSTRNGTSRRTTSRRASRRLMVPPAKPSTDDEV